MQPSASGEGSTTVLKTPSSSSSPPAERVSLEVQRVPRRNLEVPFVALVFVVLLCVFYREVIFEGRTFLPFGSPAEVMGPAPPWGFSGVLRQNPYRLDAGGSAWQLEPWARVVGTTYRGRGLPLWNPHQFFGIPFSADAQPGPFDVLRLPAILTTRAWGWDAYYLIQAALSLAFTYGFARTAGFRIEAALVAAIGYTFCGFMFIRGNMHYAEIYHVLPLLLWGTELLVQGRSRAGLVLVAIATPVCVFAGFPEATALAFLYAGSFGVFRVIWAAATQKSWALGVRRFALLALGWIVGLGIAAPQLIPLVEYMPISFNIHPPERGLGLIALPLRAL
ncbi:MAG TPA: hypothetical protein VGK33_05345, partial [Chloroflexota bacterium]